MKRKGEESRAEDKPFLPSFDHRSPCGGLLSPLIEPLPPGMAQPAATAIAAAAADAQRANKPGSKGGVPNWQPVENLACARAALDASQRLQKQTGDALEGLASKFYGDAIKMAAQAHGFKEVIMKGSGTGAPIVWSPSLSAAHRSLNGRLFNRWQHTIKKECLTVINPILKQLLNSDGKIPSGKTPADMILETKEGLWKADQLKKRKRAPPLIALVDGNDVVVNDEEEAAPAMPADYDGGTFFLTWSVLGPMGEKHPSIRLATKQDEGSVVDVASSDVSTTLVNTSRQAQRDQALALGTHLNRPMGNISKRPAKDGAAGRNVTPKPDSLGVSSAFAQVQVHRASSRSVVLLICTTIDCCLPASVAISLCSFLCCLVRLHSCWPRMKAALLKCSAMQLSAKHAEIG